MRSGSLRPFVTPNGIEGFFNGGEHLYADDKENEGTHRADRSRFCPIAEVANEFEDFGCNLSFGLSVFSRFA